MFENIKILFHNQVIKMILFLSEHNTCSQPALLDFVTVRLLVHGKKKASDQFFVAQVNKSLTIIK